MNSKVACISTFQKNRWSGCWHRNVFLLCEKSTSVQHHCLQQMLLRALLNPLSWILSRGTSSFFLNQARWSPPPLHLHFSLLFLGQLLPSLVIHQSLLRRFTPGIRFELDLTFDTQDDMGSIPPQFGQVLCHHD